MLCAGQGWADSWQNVFSSRVATEYDTNPAMSPADPGSVWRGLFEPSYSLIGKVGENDIKAGLGLQLVRSTDSVLDPDRNSPAAFLEWLRHSDGGEFGISARYAEVATRESGVDATGRVPADSTRASRTLAGIWSNRLSELTTLSADASNEKVSYKGGNYVDYSIQSGGVKLSYALSGIATPFCRVSGIRYVPSNDDSSISLADGTLGLDFKTEHTDWTIQGGAGKVTDHKAIPEGSATGRFTGQRTQFALNAGRMVLPSGLGGFVKADQARWSLRYALSENENAGFDLEGRRNLPITFIGDRTISAISGVWIEQDLARFWKMRMYYRHWLNRINGSESVTSNILGLSLAYDNANFQPQPQLQPQPQP